MARDIVTSNIWILDKGKPLVAQHDPRFDYIDDMLSKLEDDDRVILEMRFWQRSTYAEIAEAIGHKGRQKGYYYVNRALQRFRKVLIDNGLD